MSGNGTVTVNGIFDDPFGLGPTRQRLDEAETVERMLAAGVRLAGESGLRISFDLLRLEDVIAEAGVSRSAVYKRWPRKEQYYGDLLLRLAGKAHPALAAYDSGTQEVVFRIALENHEQFRTPTGRHQLLVEMCRLGALRNFNALRERKDWRIYMAIHAAMLTLPENDYRAALVDTLKQSERTFVARMVEFYTIIITALGYRFRENDSALGMREFTLLGAAAVEGVLLTSGATTELAERRFIIDPFGTGQAREWSYPAISFASVVVALFETEDTSTWSEERMESTHLSLEAMMRTASETAQLTD